MNIFPTKQSNTHSSILTMIHFNCYSSHKKIGHPIVYEQGSSNTALFDFFFVQLKWRLIITLLHVLLTYVNLSGRTCDLYATLKFCFCYFFTRKNTFRSIRDMAWFQRLLYKNNNPYFMAAYMYVLCFVFIPFSMLNLKSHQFYRVCVAE